MELANNSSLVCHDPHSYGHQDLWHKGNPLDSPTSLFFVQVSVITAVTQIMDFCLKPLGQSSLVSQILGGVVIGPSGMGHSKVLLQTLFPLRGTVLIETVASFGIIFFYFIWCVKMDIATLLRTEKTAITIGLSVFAFTLVIPTGLSLVLKRYVFIIDKNLANALPYIAVSQTLTVVISIAVLMADLNFLHTDVGRLTMSAAMFTDISAFVLTLVMFAILQNVDGNMLNLVWIILSVIALILLIVFAMRPAILWMVKQSGGDSVSELCLVCIFLFVMLSGFLGEVIGQHYIMGAVILGLCLPEGPPLGTTLMKKMETICVGFLYPLYLAISGLQTNFFKINIQSVWIVTVIVVLAFFVKIGAVMLPGYYLNVPMKKCFVIGLIMNGRGIAEINIYNMWRGSKLLSEEEFSLMVLQILIINAIITPLIKFVYDPSEQYYTGVRCTIQHTSQDSELRIMVCIHNNENLPTIINLLEASYASRESNVAVIALVLVELLGRARPVLVAHQSRETLRSMSCNSNHIDNALRQYAEQNEGCVSVQSFTSISNFDAVYNDVCGISVDKRANILILPFHKRWEIDGSVEVTQRSIQTMNIKVLERAPCSVGILVDRGILSGSPSLLMGRSAYYVAVLFIGGADDAEALAYATRMVRHECVNVTVLRFLLFGEENSKERKRDSDLINEYRYHNAGNSRFEIIDEVVKDSIQMSTSIRRMIDYFDLVMVGRVHQECAMLQGHDQWNECPELGVMGDMLASPDFETKASVLVVQQQRVRGRLTNNNVSNPMKNQRDQLVRDVPIDQTT